MSSALAVVLMAAALAVPDSGPEKITGEVRAPQSLDLGGEWKGVWKTGGVEYEVCSLGEKGVWSYRRLPKGKRGPAYLSARLSDEGEGRLRLTWGDEPCLGIYEQDGDRLAICFRSTRKGRPTSFHAGEGKNFLILHRLKPRK